MDEQMPNGWLNVWWMSELIVGWMDGWMNGRMDRQVDDTFVGKGKTKKSLI